MQQQRAFNLNQLQKAMYLLLKNQGSSVTVAMMGPDGAVEKRVDRHYIIGFRDGLEVYGREDTSQH